VRGADGSTALLAVCSSGDSLAARLPLARLLIERGADVNAKGAAGQTPLSFASEDEMRALLRAHGARE